MSVKRCVAAKKDGVEIVDVSMTLHPERLDVFDQVQGPLNAGDHDARYTDFKNQLDEKRQQKLEFIEK